VRSGGRGEPLTAVELIKEPGAIGQALALLPGTFNPPTRAHVDMARAALAFADAVLFVLPREFPHKNWFGASFEQRVNMLQRVSAADQRLGIAISDGGLYIEMAREAQSLFRGARVELILGRDAAERIANWDYGEPGVFERLVSEFPLRVAPRCGRFEDAEQLELPPDCESISATDVRRRIESREAWEHLVPAEIVELVSEIYGR
jgi:nicotinic acid mononucleotide adenylyltransferase